MTYSNLGLTNFEVISKIPETLIGKIAFYLVNAILIVLILIIGIMIKNLIPHAVRKLR